MTLQEHYPSNPPDSCGLVILSRLQGAAVSPPPPPSPLDNSNQLSMAFLGRRVLRRRRSPYGSQNLKFRVRDEYQTTGILGLWAL